MVKCCECGLLCVRHTNTQQLTEVTDRWRKTGSIPAHLYEAVPLCFARAAKLEEEAPTGDLQARPALFLQVINKERDCPKFLTWLQGYSPKEHTEMHREDTLLRMQEEQRAKERAWQGEWRDKERAWHDEQKRNDRAWQEDQRERDRQWQVKQKWKDRGWGLVLLVIGAVVGWLIKKYLGG